MSLTKVTFSMIDGSAVNVLDYGATGNGTTDDTAAIQAAIDAAYNMGAPVAVPAGIYAITGVKVYGLAVNDNYSTVTGKATQLEFYPDAVFKMTAATGYVIRTAQSPTATIPPTSVYGLHYGVLNNVVIDMDSKGSAGLWLELAHHWQVTNIDIRNIPAGTFTYNDGYASGTYDKCGIGIKGITATAGAYNNVIVNGWLRGVSNASRGEIGLWYGTTKGQTAQQANFNNVSDLEFTHLNTAIHAEQGSVQRIAMSNIYNCGTGFLIDSDFNAIEQLFVENCTTGFNFTAGSKYNTIYNSTSGAGTPTFMVDNGDVNGMFPDNYVPQYAAIRASGSPSTQAIPPSVFTKINLPVQLYDAGDIARPADSQIRIDAFGYGVGFYNICGTVRAAVVDGKVYELSIYKITNQLPKITTRTNTSLTTSTSAASYQLSFGGTGSVTLSGTATGTYAPGTHTITCTAGTLTITVTGSVNYLFLGEPVSLSPIASFIPGASATISMQVNASLYMDTLDRVELFMKHSDSADCQVTQNANTQLFVTKAASLINVPFGGPRQYPE
jgi:hypothetical protein